MKDNKEQTKTTSYKGKGVYQNQERAEELKRGIIGLNICEECGGFCTESVPLIEGLPVNAQVSLMEHSKHANLKKGSYLFKCLSDGYGLPRKKK